MCMFKTPKVADPAMPKESAAMRSPDNGAVEKATGRRTTDKVRSAAQTVLTSGSGVSSFAQTEGKTLLGM